MKDEMKTSTPSHWFFISILIMLISAIIAVHDSSAQSIQPPFNDVLFLPFVANRHDPQSQWGNPALFSPEPKPNISDPVLLVVDQFGNPHIFWDSLYSPRFIYHAVSTSGNIHIAPVRQSLGTSYTLYPPLMDSRGNLHLLWRNWLGVSTENPYRLLYSSFDGSSWSPEEEILRTTYNNVVGIVHSDDNDSIRITYIDSNFLSAKRYQISRRDDRWTAPSNISPGIDYSLSWPDRLGGVHFWGRDIWNESILYAYWKDGNFQIKDLTRPGELPYSKSLLDGHSNLYFFSTGSVPVPGGTVQGVYQQCLDKNQNLFPPQAISKDVAISGTVRYASDGESQVIAAWKEYNASRISFAISQDCQVGHTFSLSLPEDRQWELSAVAISANPNKICVLARRLFYYDFLLQCTGG